MQPQNVTVLSFDNLIYQITKDTVDNIFGQCLLLNYVQLRFIAWDVALIFVSK